MSDTDWSAIHHAYGPATDVPELLVHLTSDDPEVRNNALYELNGNIWHQGTVYAATAHAVPGLVSVVTTARAPDRAPVLDLLKRIYCGQAYNKQHEHLETEERRQSEEFQAQIAVELAYVDAARHAVESEREGLLALLGDASAEVRSATASLLCALKGEDAIERLEARIVDEEDEVVRSHLVGALSIIETAYPREKLEAFLEDDSLLVRREAAVNLSYLLKEQTPTRVVRLLFECVLRADELEDDYVHNPYRKQGMAFDTLSELSRLAAVKPELLVEMAEAIGQASPAVALEVWATVAWRAKEASNVSAYLRALELWLAKDENWNVPGARNVMLDLELPVERDALGQALSKDQADSVEAFVHAARACSTAAVLLRPLVVAGQQRTVEEWWRELSDFDHEGPTMKEMATALLAEVGGDVATAVMWHAAQLPRLKRNAGKNARELMLAAIAEDHDGTVSALRERAAELVEHGAPRRATGPGMISITTQLFGHVLEPLVTLIERDELPKSPELDALVAACRRSRTAKDLTDRYDAHEA